MLDFKFYNPVRVHFGKGKTSEVNNEIPMDARVLVIYNGGEIGEKFAQKSINFLEKEGTRKIFRFNKIEPNPQFNTLMEAVEIVRKEKIDFILAVGGGSVIDGTKFIQLVARNKYYKGKEKEVLTIDDDITHLEPGVPFGAITTLPATASEMNPHAVISHGNDKISFSNYFCFAKFAILDPEYTYTIPNHIMASGIADAAIHAMEQYITYPVNGRFQDGAAEAIIKALFEAGPKVQNDTEKNRDEDARANWMWCAGLAMNTLIGSGVPQDFTSHMLGHEITALHGIPHGQSLVLVMPSLLRYCKKDKKEKLLQFAKNVWGITKGTDAAIIEAGIQKTQDHWKMLGLKLKLSDFNITEADIEPLVQQLIKHGKVGLGEHGKLQPDDFRAIYKMAL